MPCRPPQRRRSASADRCTNCHGSIHGTDTPTPSGGSRFIDKGLPTSTCSCVQPARGQHSVSSHSAMSPLPVLPLCVRFSSHVPNYGMAAAGGALGMLSSGYGPAVRWKHGSCGGNDPAGTEPRRSIRPIPSFPALTALSTVRVFWAEWASMTRCNSRREPMPPLLRPDPEAPDLGVPSQCADGHDYPAASQLTAGNWAAGWA